MRNSIILEVEVLLRLILLINALNSIFNIYMKLRTKKTNWPTNKNIIKIVTPANQEQRCSIPRVVKPFNLLHRKNCSCRQVLEVMMEEEDILCSLEYFMLLLLNSFLIITFNFDSGCITEL